VTTLEQRLGDQGLAARRAALAALAAVLDGGEALDAAVEAAAGRLEPRDRAFLRALVSATLRRLPEIDGLIDACLDRPLPKTAMPVRHILRLAVAQLIFLDVPHHAALDTANRLAGGHRNPQVRRLKPLVNGVLRRLTREAPAPLEGVEAGRRNTPDWLLQSWAAAYGAETAARIAAAHLGVPPTDITLKPGEDAAQWAETLGADVLPTGSLRLHGDGAIPALPGYAEGRWWVQDAAAALPVRLAGALAGRTVIDLCAAPGGKTAQLAAGGARVTAVDRSEARLKRVAENLARLGLEARIAAADATTWQPEAPADIVLLDAPCSATGTIRRHPDLPRVKGPKAVAEMLPLQAALMEAAAPMVAPGGTLIYCVCSLQPEEGEAQVAKFLDHQKDFQRKAIGMNEAPELAEAITADGALRLLPSLWPERSGLDGFFIARLVRDSA
jgi:16S rRNA (cytosine967-C5)-methyltransferase